MGKPLVGQSMVKMPSIGYQGVFALPETPQNGDDSLGEGIGNGKKGRIDTTFIDCSHRQKPQTKSNQLCSGISEEQLFSFQVVGEKAEASSEKGEPYRGYWHIAHHQTEEGKGAAPHTTAARAEPVDPIDQVVGIGEKQKPQKGGGYRQEAEAFQANSAKDGKKGGRDLPCQLDGRCESFGIVPYAEADDNPSAKQERHDEAFLDAEQQERGGQGAGHSQAAEAWGGRAVVMTSSRAIHGTKPDGKGADGCGKQKGDGKGKQKNRKRQHIVKTAEAAPFVRYVPFPFVTPMGYVIWAG